MIDLHTHSTASDGTFHPEDLVDYAISQGITHLSLTDHDTIDGVESALLYARERGLKFAGGVEVSAEFKDRTMHILGYGIDYRDKTLNEKLKFLRKAREERNPKIVQKLNEAGFDLCYEDVVKEAGGKVVGRPHFASVMLKKGYVSSTQEAFDRYLKKGAQCYVDKFRFEPEEAIRIILESGGVPVLAHPLSLKLNFSEIREVVIRLKESGLEGLECFYRNHTKEDEENLLQIAQELDLLVTGGSDFHGSNRPNIFIGIGEGNMRIPDWVAEKFFSRIRGN